MDKVGCWTGSAQVGSRAEWFYRRPIFWWALAVVAGLFAAYPLSLPHWFWIGLAPVGLAVGACRRMELGIAFILAGLFAGAATLEKSASIPQHFRNGAPVTLRGKVVRPLGPGRFLFHADRRLTLQGWVRENTRLGVLSGEPAAPGDLLQVSGTCEQPLPSTNPGGRDLRLQWLRQGVRTVVHLRPEGFRRLRKGKPAWWEAASARLRAHLVVSNARTLSPEGALVANSFLLGQQDDADPQVREPITKAFRDSGTIHLLVVSGTQISLVLAGFLWLGWRLWRLRFVLWSLGMAAVGGFYLLTSGDPSVTRAAVMGGVFVVGLSLNRETDGENCLGIAALALLTFNRFLVFDIGAQLSFAAVWALLRVAPPITRALSPADPESPGYPLLRAAAATVGVAVAAYLATAPILAFHFQRASWSGVLANLPMSLLGGFFTYLAFAHTLLAGVGCAWLAWPVDYLAQSLTGWARLFADRPFGAADVFPFPLWLLPVHFGLLSLAGRASSRARLFACLAAPAALLLISERCPAPPPAAPTLRALDVGQGDAVLLQGPDGSRMLVDAGPEDPGRTPGLVRTLRGLRIPDLDAVIVSHTHQDHVGGLPALLDRMRVRLLIHRADPGAADEAAWARVLRAAARQGTKQWVPEAGDRLQVGRTSLQFLGPLDSAGDNEASLIFRWDAGDARFLLTGDAGAPSEEQLLKWGPELRADVLKVGHHGSAGSSSARFLAAVDAPVSVISCGRDNRFGHPSPAALKRLETSRTQVLRTDTGGMVTVRVGRSIEVETALPE